MIFDLHRRRGLIAVPCVLILLASFGCGSGGGGGGDDGPIGPGPTPVATAIQRPAEEVVVPAGGDISDAIAVHPNGATIIVESGVYDPIVVPPGTVFGTIFVQAGEQELGAVTIVGDGRTAAVNLNGQTNIVIDGLQLIGGDYAAVYAVDSDGVEIRNCVIRRAGHGIVFERVSRGLAFDNLLYENDGNGVMALGTSDFRIINNTIYGGESGIFVGSSPGDAVSILAGDTFVQNNVIDGPGAVGVKVEADNGGGYFAGYNINRRGYQGVPMGFRDLDSNPLYIFPPGPSGFCSSAECNFRVQVAGGRSSPAIDRGDPDTDPLLVAVLRDRTIRVDNFADGEVPDLGYHYPGGMPTPTPFPTTPTPGAPIPTATSGPPVATSTATLTPTFTPTPTSTPTPTLTSTPTNTSTPTDTPTVEEEA